MTINISNVPIPFIVKPVILLDEENRCLFVSLFLSWSYRCKAITLYFYHFFFKRNVRKNAVNNALHSSCSTPEFISTW